MADIGAAIREYLADNAEVSAIAGARIYPDVMPQGATTPAVTFRRISTTHESNLNGSKVGIAHTRIEFECFATQSDGGRDKANELSEAIRKSGILDLGHTTTNGVDILAVEIDAGQRHDIEQPTNGTDAFRYVTSQDYAFTFREDF